MAARRTLIVGDVHGCVDELDELLRVADFAPGDRLVFVGDLVAKGPDSAGVIARAREFEALAVLGNHEMPVLAYHAAIRLGEEPPKMKSTHRAAAQSLSESDVVWLESLPYHLELREHELIIAHAGIVPGVAMTAQPKEALLTMRCIRADGSWSKAADDGTPWATLYTGPDHVVFGHDAVRKLQLHPFATGLDTGCVYGGVLTAIEFPSRRIHQVRAHREWSPF